MPPARSRPLRRTPPMSTTIEPVGSAIGNPAPMAAAMGSSMRNTCEWGRLQRRPIPLIARCSTAWNQGTQITMRGWHVPLRVVHFLMKT